jgi:hypothetical protein
MHELAALNRLAHDKIRIAPMASAPKPVTACREKARLTDTLALITEEYGDSLRNLYSKMDTMSSAEYANALRKCDDLRTFSEQARQELLSHVLEHGC